MPPGRKDARSQLCKRKWSEGGTKDLPISSCTPEEPGVRHASAPPVVPLTHYQAMAFAATSMSPVLITGGCGFIGFHLTQHVLDAEPSCQVHVLDIDTSRNRVDHSNVTYHTCDITSAQAVDDVVQRAKPRTTFHTASPDSMVLNGARFFDVNVTGTRNLLTSLTKLNSSNNKGGTARALVFTSTSSVIHDNVSDLLDADETLPVLQPPVQKRVYTLTKATAEAEILAANRKKSRSGSGSGSSSTGKNDDEEDDNSGLLTCSLRPCTAVGEADTVCLGKMLPNAVAGRTRFQMGEGKNVYDFMYVGNLADAHILAARRLLSAWGQPPPPPSSPEGKQEEKNNGRVDGECFNITNDERVLFWDFARKVSAAAGHPVAPQDIKVIPVWIGLLMGWVSEWVVWLRSFGNPEAQPNMSLEGCRLSTIHRTLNMEKAKRVLGYRPRVSLDEGIERGVRSWLDEHGYGGKQ